MGRSTYGNDLSPPLRILNALRLIYSLQSNLLLLTARPLLAAVQRRFKWRCFIWCSAERESSASNRISRFAQHKLKSSLTMRFVQVSPRAQTSGPDFFGSIAGAGHQQQRLTNLFHALGSVADLAIGNGALRRHIDDHQRHATFKRHPQKFACVPANNRIPGLRFRSCPDQSAPLRGQRNHQTAQHMRRRRATRDLDRLALRREHGARCPVQSCHLRRSLPECLPRPSTVVCFAKKYVYASAHDGPIIHLKPIPTPPFREVTDGQINPPCRQLTIGQAEVSAVACARFIAG